MWGQGGGERGGAEGGGGVGWSPGARAGGVERGSEASGVNPVSERNWEDHIPAEWPARTLLWMCSAAADPFLGQELALRDEGLRKTVGLI